MEALVLLAMLLPGAAESLIRVSNDVGVFAWSLLLLAALQPGARLRPASTALLAAVGPLIKLTALPVVAYAAVVVWRRRGWRAGALIGASGLAVLPLQWLRGWGWGGTLEANVATVAHDSLPDMLTGLAHSAYTFGKTAIWLGGWSSFRPPTWLLVAAPVLALALGMRTLRVRPRVENLPAHAPALVLAALGFVAFAYGKRQLFGFWGAVGGWYFWGWAPWLAILANDLVDVREERARELVIGAVGGAALLNFVWFEVASRLYG